MARARRLTHGVDRVLMVGEETFIYRSFLQPGSPTSHVRLSSCSSCLSLMIGLSVLTGAPVVLAQSAAAAPPAPSAVPSPPPSAARPLPPTAEAMPPLASTHVDSPGARPFPSLSQAVQLGKDHAPSMVSARSEVAMGKSLYAGAKFGILGNPYLEIFTERGTTAGTSALTIQSNLWLPIEVSGQRSRRIAEVDSLVAWKSASVEAVRADVAGRVVMAYGSAVVAAERVRVFEAILETSKAEAALYQARMAAGDATLRDAKLAEVEVARNAVTVAEGRADVARAISELEQLTGLADIAPPEGTPPEPPRIPANAATSAERYALRAPAVASSEREADYYQRAKERTARESHAPVNLILSGGRGELGEARVGGGISWTFPVFRKNQGEQAYAEAEQSRATAERDVRARVVSSMIRGLARESEAVRMAVDQMVEQGEPAAQASVEAAITTQRAGKGELLNVLIARRDLVLLKARRLELLRREWQLAGEFVSISGELSHE
jgi:outer membrane protein, heavy metal efflux system